MTNFHKLPLALAGLALSLGPAVALAQTATVTSASVTAPGLSANASASSTVKLGAADTKAKQKGDQEITRRIDKLNALNTRISQMQEVSDTFKTSLSQAVAAQISALTSLQAKIDADTDAATLKTDIQAITADYRVFVLVVPQARIAAAADRVVTLTSMFSTLGAKLQARLQTAAQAGADTAALNQALTDISNKIQDAQAKAQAAVNATVALQPDQGDATVRANNTTTLKTGRSDIQAAQQDLVAARKDVNTIVAGLAKLPKASATASSTTSTNAQ